MERSHVPQVALTHCISSLSPDQTWTISFKGLDGGSVLPEAPQLEEKKEGDCTPHYEIYRSLDFIPQVWTSSAHVPSNRWDIRQTYVGNYKLFFFFFSLMVKIFLKKKRLDKFYSEILTAPPLHTL